MNWREKLADGISGGTGRAGCPGGGAGMKLEPGKYYRTRNGETVGPCQPHDGTKQWPFDAPFAGGDFWYSENGESATGNSGFDIIAEWDDASPADPAPLPMPPAQVAVKPLVWKLSERTRAWRADCELTRDVFIAYQAEGKWWAGSQCFTTTCHPDADAAKHHLDQVHAARIRAALDVAPAPDADEWRGVLMWTDDGEKTLFDWCAGGGDPDGEFSRIGLRRETADGRVLYRTYTANGQWGEPAPMVDAPPAPDVAALVEALRFYANAQLDGYDIHVCDYGLRIEAGEIIKDSGDRARAALAAWEGRNE